MSIDITEMGERYPALASLLTAKQTEQLIASGHVLPNNCRNCGPYPCYHICPNSLHYYSPEQERYDDQFYGDDYMHEAYGPSAENLADPDEYDELVALPVVIGSPLPDTDDIPF